MGYSDKFLNRVPITDVFISTVLGFRGVLCNCCYYRLSRPLFQLWDIRKKAAIQTFQNTYQVLAVTFNDTSDQIISGGIDNDIKVC